MARGYPDFEGQKSKLFTVADWAAVEATDKNLYGFGNDKAFAGSASVSYAVSVGKAFYIATVNIHSHATAVANADLNQIVDGLVWDNTDGTTLARLGGNGGASVSYVKPIVIPSGHTVIFYVYNWANHNCNINITALGYEV